MLKKLVAFLRFNYEQDELRLEVLGENIVIMADNIP